MSTERELTHVVVWRRPDGDVTFEAFSDADAAANWMDELRAVNVTAALVALPAVPEVTP